MKRILTLLLLTVLLMLLMLPVASAEEMTATEMRLSLTEGDILVTNGAEEAVDISQDMRLFNGYTVYTGDKSFAWITLDDTKACKLDQNSSVTILKDGGSYRLFVNFGCFFFNVAEKLHEDETMTIETATMVTGIRGTSGEVRVSQDLTTTTMALFDGATVSWARTDNTAPVYMNAGSTLSAAATREDLNNALMTSSASDAGTVAFPEDFFGEAVTQVGNAQSYRIAVLAEPEQGDLLMTQSQGTPTTGVSVENVVINTSSGIAVEDVSPSTLMEMVDSEVLMARVSDDLAADIRAVVSAMDSTSDYNNSNMHRHTYPEKMPRTYTWTPDNVYCTGMVNCSNSNCGQLLTQTVKASTQILTPPTCTTRGEMLFSVVFSHEAFSDRSTRGSVDATGHRWCTPNFAWSADLSSCYVSRFCLNDPTHAEAGNAIVVSTVTTAPTCTATGEDLYTATAFLGMDCLVDTRTVTTPALGHNFSNTSYNWNGIMLLSSAKSAAKSGVSCYASASCSNPGCTEVQSEYAIISGMVAKDATCTEPGQTAYSAYFSNSVFSPQNEVFSDIPALGHNLSTTASYSWDYAMETCTASLPCSRCSYQESETRRYLISYISLLSCTTDEETELHVSFSDSRFTDQVQPYTYVPATGHRWGKATFVWVGYDSCTCSCTCLNDSSHTDIRSCQVDTSVDVPFDCTTAGRLAHVANVQFETGVGTNVTGFSDTRYENVAALGHYYGTASYQWPEDDRCVATLPCTRSGCTHAVTESVTAASGGAMPSTCTTDGHFSWVATFSDSRFTEQTNVVYIPAAGHTWSDPQYDWDFTSGSISGTMPTCTGRASCSICNEKVQEIVVASSETLDTGVVYTATFTKAPLTSDYYAIPIVPSAPGNPQNTTISPAPSGG